MNKQFRIWNWRASVALAAVALGGCASAAAQQLRSLGIDVSAWESSISVANWNTLKRATNSQVSGVNGDGRDFVIIRSSRGGTTGEDHRQGGYASGNNTFYNLSQRYDDPYFPQNVARAVTAGLIVGTYHFARPDVIASTTNSDGVTTAGVDNSGTDEADHMIQMAGPWMRPGFLPPTLDLESGQSQRTSAQLTTFAIQFSDRIYAVMGIRPMTYVNGNYASYLQSSVVPAIPYLWSARWPNQSAPNTIDWQNGQPKDSYTPIYGPWDDAPLPTHPWKVWQYASTAHVNAIGGGASSVDVDVAQGGVEFLKDLCIPAIWMTNADGLWTTLSNWNSGQAPVTPVPGSGQLARVGTLVLPVAGLPGSNDTVVLDRTNTSFTVTLSSGAQNIRKLYMREALNITGGSLTINYTPAWDSTTFGAQFSGPVLLSNNAAMTVHTLQVDATRTFTVNGATLAFNTISLMPTNTTPAKLVLTGDMNFGAVAGTTATITNGSGAGTSGSIDLGGGVRTCNVSNGVSLAVFVPVANGGITKLGPGTMRIETNCTYSGVTTVAGGAFELGSGGAISGSSRIVLSNAATFNVSAKSAPFALGAAQTLAGNGSVIGRITVNGTLAPGASVGTLSFGTNLTLTGTTIMEVSHNGSVTTNDTVLCGGLLTFGGALVITNIGPDALTNGDVFQLFSANTFASAFTSTNLPTLAAGLQWDTSGLGTGVVKVAALNLTPPVFQSITRAGNNLLLSGSNGLAGSQYYLVTSTNLALAPSNWSVVLTNFFDTGGTFSNSLPVDAADITRYYRVRLAN